MVKRTTEKERLQFLYFEASYGAIDSYGSVRILETTQTYAEIKFSRKNAIPKLSVESTKHVSIMPEADANIERPELKAQSFDVASIAREPSRGRKSSFSLSFHWAGSYTPSIDIAPDEELTQQFEPTQIERMGTVSNLQDAVSYSETSDVSSNALISSSEMLSLHENHNAVLKDSMKAHRDDLITSSSLDENSSSNLTMK